MFPIDRIVFNQQQLDEICGEENISVILCDNEFKLPQTGRRRYIAIGDVKAKIQLSPSAASQCSIVFDNFVPEYGEKNPPIYANVEHGIRPLSVYLKKTGINTGSYSSYVGSSVSSFTSFFAASFIGSFMTSFSGSFAVNFTGSFVGKSSSYAGSSAFQGTFFRKRRDYIIKEFAVNGYGINLI